MLGLIAIRPLIKSFIIGKSPFYARKFGNIFNIRHYCNNSLKQTISNDVKVLRVGKLMKKYNITNITLNRDDNVVLKFDESKLIIQNSGILDRLNNHASNFMDKLHKYSDLIAAISMVIFVIVVGAFIIVFRAFVSLLMREFTFDNMKKSRR